MTIEELEKCEDRAASNARSLSENVYGADKHLVAVATWSLVAVLADIAIQMHRIGDFVDVVRKDYEKDHE